MSDLPLFSSLMFAPHRCRRFFVSCFCPNIFIHPTLSPIESIFQDFLRPRASEHTPGKSKHRGKLACGGSAWIFDCAAGFKRRFPLKRCRFLFGSRRGFHVDFFSPTLPVPNCPRRIHATQNPQIHATFGNNFRSGFAGFSALVFVAAFGC